jgi:RimJ/RimL family protein N-acetyltransferase
MCGAQPDLITGRLVLRSLCPDDAPQIAALVSDPLVSEYMMEIPHPCTEPLAREWIASLTTSC